MSESLCENMWFAVSELQESLSVMCTIIIIIIIIIIIKNVKIRVTLSWITLQGHFTELLKKKN